MKNTLLIVVLMTLLPVIGFTQTNDLLTLMVKKQGQEQALLDGYGKSLDSIMTSLTAKGDLDNYVVVETEKKRFEAEKSVPVVTNGLFKVLVGEYLKARVTLLKQYILAFDELVKAEMKAGKIDNAKEAKAEKDKSMLELAAIEVQLPKEVVKTKTSIVGKWGWGNGDISTLEFSADGRITARDVKSNKIRKGESGKWTYVDDAKIKIRRTENAGAVMFIDYDENNPDIFVQSNNVKCFRLKNK